jgi:hypothetical protein
MTPMRVSVFHYVKDKEKEPIKNYSGHMTQPTKRVFWQFGTLIAIGTSYEQLGYEGNNYVGQFPVAILSLDDGTFTEYNLCNIQITKGEPKKEVFEDEH